MGRNKKLRLRLDGLRQRITDHQIKIALEQSALLLIRASSGIGKPRLKLGNTPLRIWSDG